MPEILSNPWKQTQVPVVSSQVPWFEQVPSPGQSNSKEKKRNLQKDKQHPFDTIQIILEQSNPCLPASQEHSPEVRSHWPCPLQGISPPGHGISEENIYFIQFHINFV